MANIEDYNASIDAIKAITDAEVKNPGIPIEVYIQEGENLCHWCQDDKAPLEAAGLDWGVVNAISVRALALHAKLNLFGTKNVIPANWLNRSGWKNRRWLTTCATS